MPRIKQILKPLMEDKEVNGKLYVSANSLLRDSYKLARMVMDSKFNPDIIVFVCRGGSPVGIALHEFLNYHGIKSDPIPIRTMAYKDISDINKRIQVDNLGYLKDNVSSSTKMLLVDDVWDTGRTMEALKKKLKELLKDNLPKDLRIGTVYFKTGKNETDDTPDYHIHETDSWIVFPHELYKIKLDEIREGKGEKMTEMFKE